MKPVLFLLFLVCSKHYSIVFIVLHSVSCSGFLLFGFCCCCLWVCCWLLCGVLCVRCYFVFFSTRCNTSQFWDLGNFFIILIFTFCYFYLGETSLGIIFFVSLCKMLVCQMEYWAKCAHLQLLSVSAHFKVWWNLHERFQSIMPSSH